MGVAVEEWPCPSCAAAQVGAFAPRAVSAAAPRSAPRLLIVARLPLLDMLVHLPDTNVFAPYGQGCSAEWAARRWSGDGGRMNSGSGKQGKVLTVY
ncbi:hypothetical protein GCM10022206_43150 [Streptomyces chiangmaiensis]